jgi:hypothetical protein
MRKREVADLLIKLMVVFAMLQFAPSLLYVLGMLGSIHSSPTPGRAVLLTAITLIAPLIWIGFCLLVLRFSSRIAARLVPDDGDCGAIFSLSFKECQTLGYNFIGLLLIVQSFPQLMQLISTILFDGYMSSLARDTNLYRGVLPKLLAFLTQFILGLVLFLRAGGLSNLWESLQQKTMPMRKTPENKSVQDIGA